MASIFDRSSIREFGARGRRSPSARIRAPQDPMTMARTRGANAHDRAQDSRGGFASAVQSFDPSSFMQQAAGSMFAGLDEQFKARGARRNASNNARGLFNSPIGQAGENRDFNTRLSQALAGLSMQGGQMEMGRMGMLGDLAGMDRGDSHRYEDMQVDLTMSERDRKAQDKAGKRGMWGSIIGGGLTAAGTALGGPLGGMVGAGIGKLFSDEDLKEDLIPTDAVLPRVKKLRARSWEWNEEGRKLTGKKKGEREKGVIAQDVEKAFPELVTKHIGSGRRQVDYGGLASTLVSALGEMDEKIDRMATAGR